VSPTATARRSATAAYDELIHRVRDAHLLGSTGSLLHWDQEVMMPPGGVEHRSRQMSLLARLQHETLTADRIGELLAECEAGGLADDPMSPAAVNLRELRRTYDRRTRLPADLVAEEARLASVAQHHWVEARKESDFQRFRPDLTRVVDLLRRKAECLGWPADGEPWDALAEDFEPGCTARDVEAVFEPLRSRLRALLDQLRGGTPPDLAARRVRVPLERQREAVRAVAEQIGFDFTRGRLDTSAHPFCGGTHCNDVRLTTRFREDGFLDALSSTMHEAGHGMYEQGLLAEHVGTPMGDAVSLGIHESQSRMWENQVGRSLAFCEWLNARFGSIFGLKGPDAARRLFGAANRVEPDLIRVEADEATYNLHVMVRFDLERRLLRGDLDVADVPEAWNQGYRASLGVEVPDDARGCLQDVHWSGCMMGYFPTYTLGNLYAAQFYRQARRELGDLEGGYRTGRFQDLKAWLNQRIHAHGQRHRAADLCVAVTGEPLSADPLMEYLEGKLRPLYRV
jgi:carboxypeptidase Taq